MTASATPSTATGRMDVFFQPRRAAFWLLLGFLACGVHATGMMIYSGLRVVPIATLLGVGLWTLYTLPILLFLRSLDIFEQHPRSGFVLAFAWGGLAAIFLAVPANGAVFSLSSKLVSPEFGVAWGAAMAGPTHEEPLKLLGVILLVLVARNQFRTILSVMALGAVTGLGFQVVEDLSYTINGAVNYWSTDQIAPVINMLVVRGVICGLWSHTAYTAVASFGIGYFVARPHAPLAQRLLVAAGALLLAWGMHFFWNSPLLSATLAHGPLIIAYFPLKGAPVIISLLLFWRVAQREENRHLAALAEQFVAEDLISADERPGLVSAGERRLLRKALRQSRGRSAARALARLQKAQLQLVRLHGEGAAASAIKSQAALVRDMRQRLTLAQPPQPE
jgi:RsiW-degrading membrane proteinase PrsW (M82 family)